MRWIGRNTAWIAAVCLPVLLAGCNLYHGGKPPHVDTAGYDLGAVATQIEYPDVQRCTDPAVFASQPPRTVDQGPPTEFWDLTLEQVITIALQTSPVIRDLGGRVLTNPDGAPTIFDPAIQESDPRFGPEGALSAFDAQLATSLFWSRNDQAINNIVLGGGVREIVQDLGDFQAQLTKTAATGTQLSLRNQTQYNQSNQPGNLFPSSWDTQFEMSVTQPLLRGAGVTFNRIAGPNATVGLTTSTGVLIARINTDVSLADFEARVRDFVSDLEDAYWDLYFAYRDLDAKMLARDSALETWRAVHAKFVQDLEGGQADREAQAREQYFFFQDLVQDTLVGAPVAAQSVGVYRGERRLRLLMGLPANDGRLIRPADEPSRAQVVFDWDEALKEALTRRVELRRQMWQIKRRELELIAARNFLLPQFDAVALYRWRGFGDDLTGGGGGRFGSAFKDLSSGDHQEWQLGLQFNYQFGYRQAWAGVRQAQLQLARAKAILKQQELEISHGLSEAIAELSRAYASVQTSFNRLNAAVQRRDATDAALQADRTQLEFLLQAQRALADAQTRYFQSLALYARAVKNVHLQKGSLLEYHGIYLSEGPWPEGASADAMRIASRLRRKRIDYRLRYPHPFSHGAYAQRLDTGVSQATYQEPVPAEEIPPGQLEPAQPAPGPRADRWPSPHWTTQQGHIPGQAAALPAGTAAERMPQQGGRHPRWPLHSARVPGHRPEPLQPAPASGPLNGQAPAGYPPRQTPDSTRFSRSLDKAVDRNPIQLLQGRATERPTAGATPPEMHRHPGPQRPAAIVAGRSPNGIEHFDKRTPRNPAVPLERKPDPPPSAATGGRIIPPAPAAQTAPATRRSHPAQHLPKRSPHHPWWLFRRKNSGAEPEARTLNAERATAAGQHRAREPAAMIWSGGGPMDADPAEPQLAPAR